jgi:hypothetical protein
MADTSLSDKEHSELILLYESSVSEIAGFKQQQWTTTYYTLLVQAGLVASGQVIGNRMHGNSRFVLVVLIALSVVFGLSILRTLQKSIKARRERLRQAREYFGEPFKSARAVPKDNDPVPHILAGAQSVGALVAGWLVVVWL